MTSLKQIEANRRNALKSTGPRTEDGKQQSSRNAVRHGLTAETVVEPLEDPEDYKAFEQAVTADYDPQSAAERELILRLASLLWRLRRATSIETGLLSIEDEILREREHSLQTKPASKVGSLTEMFQLEPVPAANFEVNTVSRRPMIQSDVARRFLRAANLDNGVFVRLGRYEMALWRQVRQTLFTLEGMRWRVTSRYPSQHLWRRRAETPPD